jgi:regulator of replication initiation timing
MANQIEILINAKDNASKVFDQAQTRMKKFTKQLESMRVPMMVTATALTGIGVMGVKAASNLVEAQNKSSRVFKSSQKIVEQFAKGTASAYGLSKRAAFEYTGTLGLVLNAAERSSEETAHMSVEISKLAGDIASFNNIPVSEALDKLRSGLVGEAEPLRTVGVMMSEAATQAHAMEMGLAASTKELTVADKMYARYNLILKQTEEQQGDAIATADTFAGKMRALTATFEDANAELGEHFVEAAADAVGGINAVLEAWNKLPDAAQKGIGWIGAFTAALSAMGVVALTLKGPLGVMKNMAVGGAGLAAKAAPAIGTGIGTALGSTAGALGLGAAGIALVGGAAFGIWDQFRKGADEIENLKKRAVELGIESKKLTLPYEKLAELVIEAELEMRDWEKNFKRVRQGMQEYDDMFGMVNEKAALHNDFLAASVELADEMGRAITRAQSAWVATLTPPDPSGPVTDERRRLARIRYEAMMMYGKAVLKDPEDITSEEQAHLEYISKTAGPVPTTTAMASLSGDDPSTVSLATGFDAQGNVIVMTVPITTDDFQAAMAKATEDQNNT